MTAQSINVRASRLVSTYGGNSARLLAFIPDVLAHIEGHRDTSALSTVLDGVDARDSAIMWKIVKACIGEESMSKGKDKATGRTTFKLRPAKRGGFVTNDNTLGIVREFVNAGASFRSKALLEEVTPEKAAKAFDLDAFKKAVLAKVQKDMEKAQEEGGLTLDTAREVIESIVHDAYVKAMTPAGTTKAAA